MKKRLNAFLLDLNGTMINDMPWHIRAWHRILNDPGAGISLKRMNEECYGKNQEVTERVMPELFSTEEKKKNYTSRNSNLICNYYLGLQNFSGRLSNQV